MRGDPPVVCQVKACELGGTGVSPVLPNDTGKLPVPPTKQALTVH